MERRHPNHPGELSTDARVAEISRDKGEISARARALELLLEAKIPFVVGGAYAFCVYTGIYRDTKDLDVFLRKEDAPAALDVLARDGWRTERTDEVWLYKGFKGAWFVDLIFSSGNGVATVDDDWFEHAVSAEVMGHSVRIAPPEEMIWSKAFVLERERYDGSDVLHLLRSTARTLDWRRLVRRFDRYWEVLFAHLMLFRFTYPSEREQVPTQVMVELLTRTVDSMREGDWSGRFCRGTLLSRVNFGLDVHCWGYQDGRVWDELDRSRVASREESNGRTDVQSSSGGGG